MSFLWICGSLVFNTICYFLFFLPFLLGDCLNTLKSHSTKSLLKLGHIKLLPAGEQLTVFLPTVLSHFLSTHEHSQYSALGQAILWITPFRHPVLCARHCAVGEGCKDEWDTPFTLKKVNCSNIMS